MRIISNRTGDIFTAGVIIAMLFGAGITALPLLQAWAYSKPAVDAACVEALRKANPDIVKNNDIIGCEMTEKKKAPEVPEVLPQGAERL